MLAEKKTLVIDMVPYIMADMANAYCMHCISDGCMLCTLSGFGLMRSTDRIINDG